MRETYRILYSYSTVSTQLTKLAHHRGEEELLFPKLEAACGEKGLMDANVEQHRNMLLSHAHLFPPGSNSRTHLYLR